MKKTYLLLATFLSLFLISEAAAAPGALPGTKKRGNVIVTKGDKPFKLPGYTVATLPTLTAADAGALVLVTDGNDSEDTTVGGGTDKVIARWTGSAWENAGDGQDAGSAEVSDAPVGAAGDTDTSHAYSKDDIRDYVAQHDPDYDGLPDGVEAGSITLAMLDNASISAFAETILDDADAATVLATLGIDSAANLETTLSLGAYASDLLGMADADAVKAALSVDDLVTLSGAADGATHLGEFTGSTISDNGTIKAGMQELETAVEAAGAADAFTVKVDAGATAGYIGAANNDGVLRTDGTIVTYTDGGDYVTIGVHAYLTDIAGLTLEQGDILYVDGSGDIVELPPGLAGQYLKTGGAAADPSWDDPAGSGDITAVGDSASGSSFTADGTGNVLYFEGTTANGFEIALTGANPAGDVTVTIPATTGTLLLSDGDGSSLTSIDAATGDSATAFFDAGTIEHEYGGLEADVSAYDGLVKITGGSTSAVTVTAFAESILDDADEATFKATANLEIGTDVLAQQTIGIANDNLLEVDGTPASGEAAVFTANGINGLNEAEFKTAFNLEAGTDFEAVDAEIVRADTADTIGADWEWQDGIAQSFGNDNDWEMSFNSTNIAIEWTTAATSASVATVPMYKLVVDSGDSGMTADQDVFSIYKGTTKLFGVDEDGDIWRLGAIEYGGTGTQYVGLDANSGGVTPDAGSYWIYFDAGALKWSENGAEKSAAKLEDAQTFSGAKTFNDLLLQNGATSAGNADFYEDTDDGTDKVTVIAQAMAADWTLTLPPAGGSSGEALVWQADGTTDWGNPSAGSNTDGGAGAIQLNDAGSIGSDLGLTFNETTDTLTIGENGQDGAMVIYNELGATDYGHTIQPNGSQTGAITTTLPSMSGTLLNQSLTNTYLFVGSAGGVATGVAMSGDATIANDGTLSLAANSVDSDQYADGSIDFEHLSAGAKFQALAVADLNDSATPSVLTVAETTNKVISNYQASGADHVFTMPAAHANGNVIFTIGDEFQIDIEPDSGANFYLNGAAMAADEHIQNTADTLGERIVGYCVNINGTLTWMFYSGDSNFVEETP